MGITAIVLAAGEGKRMKPLGSTLPKVMLPILGKPVLDYVISNLVYADIKHIILVVSPTSRSSIKKYFSTSFKSAKVEYIVQKEQLGPAQAISLALPKVKSEYFLTQYGDSLADVNIAQNLVDKLSQNPNVDGILAIREVDAPTRYGIVKYKDNLALEIVEKPQSSPPSSHAVIGTYILKTDLYKQATKKVKFEYGKEEFPVQYLLKQGVRVITWQFNGKRVDVGKPEDLFIAGQLLARKPVKCIAFDADNTLYNTHQVAKFADLDAVTILEDKTGIDAGQIYKKWHQIVETIKDSKVPQQRTRLYSYDLLLDSLQQDKSILGLMYRQFTKSLMAKIRPAKNLKGILTNLNQTKIVITEDIKSLTTAKLKTTGLYEFFDKIITSSDTKIMKPSKKYYEFLLTKYQPEEILVVGDDWQKDLEIGATLGMQVLFVEKEEDLEKIKEIKLSKQSKNIHIMGIAGAGAAAIAGIAKNYGFSVSGCDLAPNSPYGKNLKVKVSGGHSPKHLTGVDMLVISPAVEKLNRQNEELQKARKAKIPILTWQEFQGRFLQKDKFVICVAGAYGKSTTTAMISQILTDAGFDPTCEIGAKVLAWQSNFRAGISKYYVCEADEYNNNFLNYKPDIAVILNMAWDHPDFFKSHKDVINSYQKFVSNIKPQGTLVIQNNPDLIKLLKSAKGDIKIVRVEDFGKLKLSIIGNFRKQNANAALTVAKILGIDLVLAKRAVENFKGTGRRLEYKGEIRKVKFYDDYAVQPYTVFKTADALKVKFKDKKVTLVFEPHTFTRINTFFNDFVKSLKYAKVDEIFITDVYAAREKGDGKALSLKLASAVGMKAKYTGSLKHSAAYVRKHLEDFDIVCSMGAGDSYKLFGLVK